MHAGIDNEPPGTPRLIDHTRSVISSSGRRIGAVLLFTFVGMALGGWLAGMLHDLTGSYTILFLAGGAALAIGAVLCLPWPGMTKERAPAEPES